MNSHLTGGARAPWRCCSAATTSPPPLCVGSVDNSDPSRPSRHAHARAHRRIIIVACRFVSEAFPPYLCHDSFPIFFIPSPLPLLPQPISLHLTSVVAPTLPPHSSRITITTPQPRSLPCPPSRKQSPSPETWAHSYKLSLSLTHTHTHTHTQTTCSRPLIHHAHPISFRTRLRKPARAQGAHSRRQWRPARRAEAREGLYRVH